MDMNLKAFMRDDLKNKGTMEFEGIERFKDDKGKKIPFILRQLSSKEIKEIRNLYRTKEVFRDKKNGGRPVIDNGNVVMVTNYDADRAGMHIMVESFVQPKLDAPELMEYYGVLDRLDMPEIIFSTREEMRYANECVLIACGLMDGRDEKEVVENIKN